MPERPTFEWTQRPAMTFDHGETVACEVRGQGWVAYRYPAKRGYGETFGSYEGFVVVACRPTYDKTWTPEAVESWHKTLRLHSELHGVRT